MVIPCRTKKKKKPIHCFFSCPFSLPLCLRAVILLLLLLLVLFFRGSRCGCVVHFDPFSSFAHTDADNGLRHTDGTAATRKRQAAFFVFFFLRSPSGGVACGRVLCGRACALVTVCACAAVHVDELDMEKIAFFRPFSFFSYSLSITQSQQKGTHKQKAIQRHPFFFRQR